MSIRWRILGLIATFALLASLTFAWRYNESAKESISQRGADFIGNQAELLAVILRDAYEEMASDTLVLSDVPPILGIARTAGGELDPVDGSSYEEWCERLQAIFTNYLTRRPHYLQLRYIGVADDARERVRVDSAFEGGEFAIRVKPAAELQSKGNEPYIRENLDAEPGDLYFSAATPNVEHGRPDPRTLVVRCVVPVHHAGELFGFLVVNADARAMLQRRLDRVRMPEGQIGLVLTDGPDVLFFDAETGWSLLDPEGSDERSRWVAQVRSTVLPRSDSGPIQLDGELYYHREVDLAIRSWRGARRLRVAALMPERLLLGRLEGSHGRGVLLSMGIVLAGCLVSVYFAGLIARPLVRMAERVREYVPGTDLELPVRRRDEVGQLARSFEKLTRQLDKSRQEAERARDVEREANAAKSAFLANMSHEIRTPLNAIIGLTDLVLSSDLDPTQRDYIRVVANAGESLLAVLNDVLDFSKIESGKLELDEQDFQIHDLIGDSMKVLAVSAHEKGIEVTTRIAPGVPPVLIGDSARLRQVLLNLVGNAIKFTEQGEVHVEVRSEPSEGDGHRLDFRVRDTGIGISAQQIERIFHEFAQADVSTTRQFGGSGLGLAISRRLVERMGGELRVESELGQGSTFRFTACFGHSQRIVREHWHRALPKLQGVRMLVVDDHRPNRLVVGEILERQGIVVLGCETAETAVGLIDDAVRRRDPFRLLVLDVHLPGMDGLGLASEVRAREYGRDIPILFLGSVVDSERRERVANLDRVRTLTKPAKESEILQAIVDLLNIAAPSEGTTPEAGEAELTHESLDILLVEDSLANQKLAVALLEARGHKVRLAGDGRSAVSLVNEGEMHFDVILMDLQMPDMDGLAATRAIRAREEQVGNSRRTPIIAMTANVQHGIREQCRRAGMDAYLAKPLRPAELLARLEEVTTIEVPADGPGRTAPPERLSAASIATGDSSNELVPWAELLSLVGGQREKLTEIAEVYLEEMTDIAGRIAGALAEGDRDTLRFAAHRLRSSLGFFRVQGASSLAAGLDDRSETEPVAGLEPDFETLIEQTERVAACIQAYLVREGPP